MIVCALARIVTASVLGAVAAGFAETATASEPSSALFDRPGKVVRIPLPDNGNEYAKPELSCFYYGRFMVKQSDVGDKGAEVLSITLIAGANDVPPCREENAPSEMVVSSDDWGGYFKGVKGSYVFFDADDGWNGGHAFAVFDAANGKKLFDDGVQKWRSIQLTSSGLRIRYVRVYLAPCSLRADEAGCWQQIRQETGLDGKSPDCAPTYEREITRMRPFGQEAQVIEDPSVIEYEARVVIDAGNVKIRPVSGRATACRPAD